MKRRSDRVRTPCLTPLATGRNGLLSREPNVRGPRGGAQHLGGHWQGTDCRTKTGGPRLLRSNRRREETSQQTWAEQILVQRCSGSRREWHEERVLMRRLATLKIGPRGRKRSGHAFFRGSLIA